MSKGTDKSLVRMLTALILALVILVGSVITAVAMVKKDEENSADKEDGSSDTVTLISCQDSEIERVTLDSAKDTYSIVRDTSDASSVNWKIENRDNSDISQYNLKLIISRCKELTAVRDLGKAPSSEEELAPYGLDKASDPRRISVTVKDKGTYTYLIGNYYSSGNQCYFMDVSSSKLYLGHKNIRDYLTMTVDNLRSMPKMGVQLGGVNYFHLTRNGYEDLTLIYTHDVLSGEPIWRLTAPFLCDTDTEQISAFFESVMAISASSYVSPNGEADWDKYGFDKPYMKLEMLQAQSVEKEVVIKENYPSQVVLIGNPVENSTSRYCLFYSLHDDNGKVLDQSKIDLKSFKVYTIDAGSVNLLRTDGLELANRYFAQYHIDNMKSFDITVNGKKETINISRINKLDDDKNPIVDSVGDPVMLTTFSLDGETLPEQSMRAFYAKLISLQLAARLQDTDPTELGKEVFAFSLNTSSFIEYEDVEKEQYTVSARFYELDMNYYAVEYNGYTVCKVRKDYTDELINAYTLAKQGILPPLKDN